MKLNIKATKIELAPVIRNYIQEKMDMLEKYLGGIKPTHCDVEVGLSIGGQTSGEIYRCEVNLSIPGKLLRVEKTEKELFKAIDKVKDHLETMIKRHKEKKIAVRRSRD